MDLTELAQTVGWLDEAHRRDREQLIQLQQRVETLTSDLVEQSRQNRDLQGRLTNLQAQLSRFDRLEAAQEQLRDEVKLMFQKQGEEYQQLLRDNQALRLRDQEAQAKAVDELRRRVQETTQYKEEIAMARSEIERVHGNLQNARQEQEKARRAAEAQAKSLGFLEEQRRQDARRISDLITQQAEMQKKVEGYEARIQVLSDGTQRQDERLITLWKQRDDLKGEQSRVMEKLMLADQERERRFAHQAADVADWSKRLEEFALRLRQFGEQYEQGRRALTALETLSAELRQEQAQVAELQRLAEERQRKQFEEFNAEQERRWQRESLRWDQLAEQQERIKAEADLRMAEIEKLLKRANSQIRALWDLQEAYMTHQN
ncbi:MAG: hypothetical protein GX605_09480, partial [Chloroflexi bacterium]|nr:hypothetical protein [Chloroflexota bacterium]